MYVFIALAAASPSPASSSVVSTAPSVPTLVASPLGSQIAPPALQVVGGAPSSPGAWPSTVAVIESGYGTVCSGTLIAPTVVLTAGHCVTPYAPTEVRIGSVDGTSGGQLIPVASVTAHPDYLTNESTDIAVIQLTTPSTSPTAIIAADCVAADVYYNGAPTQIVGFGATSGDASVYPEQMYEAPSIIHDADCSEDVVNGVSTGCEPVLRPLAGELMAGGGGVDSCNGDSGGPLYSQASDGLWYVSGITSRGVATPGDCGNGGIYVRPDAFLPWLESVVGPLASPVCGTAPVTPPPASTPPPNTPPASTPPPTDPSDPGRDEGSDDPDLPELPEDAPDPGNLVLIDDLVQVAKRGLASIPLAVEGAPLSELQFEVVTPPLHGDALVTATGLLHYAHTGKGSTDRLEVTVTDLEGHAVTASYDVRVIETGGGCDNTGAPAGWLALLGLLPVLGRRR